MTEAGSDRRPGGAPSDLVDVWSDGRGGVVYRRPDGAGGVVVHDYERPFILELELTWACNLRCVHCYVDARAEGEGAAELTLDEVRSLVTAAARRGIPELSLTGGEVLLRRDLPQILAAGHEAGMGLRFVTNGSLLDDVWIRRLKPFPLKLVTVSLDAVDPSVHDAIRGCECHGATVAGIERLRAAGFRVSIITAFSRSNLSQFDRLLAWVTERRLDWQVQMTSVKGRCPADAVLSTDEYYDLGSRVAGAMASGPPINVIPMDDLATFSRFVPLNLLGETWQGGCSGGRLNLFVRANGDVTPCSALAFPPFVVGNLRESSLDEILDERRCAACLAPWLDPAKLTGTCASCPHRDRCRGGCPEILCTMGGGAHENRYCYWRIEEERIRADLAGVWA